MNPDKLLRCHMLKLKWFSGGGMSGIRCVYLVTPQIEDHQVRQQSQLRRKNSQAVERQIQLVQLQQLPQFIWNLL